VALRPPGDWLSFRLYPSTTGLSVRIGKARAVSERNRAAPPPGDTPSRLVTIAQVLSLAGALTEAVKVRDVVQPVAGEIAPAVGSQAWSCSAPGRTGCACWGTGGYPDPREVEPFDGLPLTEPTPATQVLRTGVPAFVESRERLEPLYPARRPPRTASRPGPTCR
jgi:hypothetical protein